MLCLSLPETLLAKAEFADQIILYLFLPYLSVAGMTASVSSNPSSLLRHHPDEQTPLLEANGVASETSLTNASSSPYEPQEGSEERVHDNAKLQDDGGQDRSIDSGLTSENGNGASSKTSTGIVGVISVLLLGSSIFLHREHCLCYRLCCRAVTAK